MPRITSYLSLALILLVAGCATVPETKVVTQPPPEPQAVVKAPPRIALVLGGGAARGFAHVGVVKVLEAQGIVPDIVVGTSAGSVVGALYAAGYSGFDLQKIALQLDDGVISDWGLPDRGIIKGESLQNFINRAVRNRPIEKLSKTLAIVATDLQSGEPVAFRRGNTGMAVRASASVPGLFQPVAIAGRDYVDGGLVSPVPVEVAKSLGADIVIAVDISSKPKYGKVNDTVDVLLQTFSIMGQSIGRYELAGADVVIRPDTGAISGTDFQAKHLAILEGEKAAQEAVPLIRAKIQEFTARK